MRPRTSHPSRAKTPTRRLVMALVCIVGVLGTGTVGFMWTDGWGPERALYFTIITVSTVGYGDYELSDEGRRFAALLIMGGIGLMTYFLGQITQAVVERSLDWEKAMQRRISRLSDHYIVIGFGRIGSVVCESLQDEDIPFVVVDRNEQNVEQAVRAGHLAVAADATQDDALRECGIEHARGLLCMTPADAVNIVITLSARGIRPDIPIISRGETEDSVRKMRQAGATRVISPVQHGARMVAQSITRPHIVDLINSTFSGEKRFEMCRLTVGGDMAGLSLASAGLCDTGAMVAVAIEREDGDVLFRPEPDEVLCAGDVVVCAGHPGAVLECWSQAA